MATTPEGKVKAYIKKRLTDLGCWQYWPVSNGMGMHGVPDVIGCYEGVFFAIEAKAPNKRGHKRRGCTALQMVQINDIASNGGMVAVIDGPEETKLFVTALKKQAKLLKEA